MLLAVDIGNSDLVFGLYAKGHWIHQFRHPTSRYSLLNNTLTEEGNRREINWQDIDSCVISSVVPGVTPSVERLLAGLLPVQPLVLGPAFFRSLPVNVSNPEEIGSDLVANSFAAFDRIKAACIIVDFGTALTFTTVNDQGEIIGVAIAPGLKTAMKSLFMNAAQLPEVPLTWPGSAIGKGTAHALQAGILMGYVGLVRELIHQIRSELNAPELPVVATGGLAYILPPLQEEFTFIDQLLTLDGLRLLSQFHWPPSD